jgi:thiol-disulfide isomerase/thioredoxin
MNACVCVLSAKLLEYPPDKIQLEENDMRLIVLLLAAWLLAGCDGDIESKETPQVNIAEAGDASISWYEGSIEEAFAQAESDETPVFLYWGAVWCPPCQEIKHTVFKSQQFINLTRLFIPVYLDGDTDRAQAWGEKFGVMGYPTMIVFSPAGDEVTRIPGGIDISRYNTVLELSLNQMKPTSELVQLALTRPEELSKDDFYQLAYYSWGQDSGAVPEGTDKAGMFETLAQQAPEGELSSRFYMDYLVAVARASKKEDENVILPDGLDVSKTLQGILSSDALILSTWDSLAYYPDDILEMDIFDDVTRESLSKIWSDRLFELRADETLSKAEKMAGWLPRLYVETLDDKELDDSLKGLLRSEMTAVDNATPDAYERQSVINQMSYIYRLAGMKDDAKSLLLAELDKSAAAYYFMSSLASYAEKDEQNEEALEWRRKAYESSTGEATRFQWGANYVRAMIRLSPEDEAGITGQAIALLGEFHDSDEMFAGRNFKILRRLNNQLADWQDSLPLTNLAFKAEIEKLCDSQAADSLEEKNCRSLFVEEEAVAQAS